MHTRNAIFLWLVWWGTAVIAADRPNIVFILVDDLGHRDLGCYGSTFYETVHIDRLAREGAKFTDAYAACPVCSPTRASIMTGKWPQRVGITDYIGAVSNPVEWKRDTILLPAPYQMYLDLEQPTLAKSLKQVGYATFFAGKWHLGPEGFWPEDQGFDVNKGGIERGGPYGGNKYFSPYGNPRLSDGPDGEHLPDRLASEACRFISEHREDPFFCLPFVLLRTHTFDFTRGLAAKIRSQAAATGVGEQLGARARAARATRSGACRVCGDGRSHGSGSR
jgi:arylsulfatase A-like enzyme